MSGGILQPAGVSPSLKSVDNTLLLIQMVAARMGIAALPHSRDFERQGLVVTKTPGEGLWSLTVRRRARWRAASADYRSIYSLSAQSRLRSSAVCEERGATHLRCTHSEPDHQRACNKRWPVAAGAR